MPDKNSGGSLLTDAQIKKIGQDAGKAAANSVNVNKTKNDALTAGAKAAGETILSNPTGSATTPSANSGIQVPSLLPDWSTLNAFLATVSNPQFQRMAVMRGLLISGGMLAILVGFAALALSTDTGKSIAKSAATVAAVVPK